MELPFRFILNFSECRQGLLKFISEHTTTPEHPEAGSRSLLSEKRVPKQHPAIWLSEIWHPKQNWSRFGSRSGAIPKYLIMCVLF